MNNAFLQRSLLDFKACFFRIFLALASAFGQNTHVSNIAVSTVGRSQLSARRNPMLLILATTGTCSAWSVGLDVTTERHLHPSDLLKIKSFLSGLSMRGQSFDQYTACPETAESVNTDNQIPSFFLCVEKRKPKRALHHTMVKALSS